MFYKYSHLLKGTNNETKFQIYIPQKEPAMFFFQLKYCFLSDYGFSFPLFSFLLKKRRRKTLS